MQRFIMTHGHLQLVRAMCVDWCGDEFGAPAIDPKRPYGNSDVVRDIAEILGVQPDTTDDYGDPDFSDEVRAYLTKLHRETQTALQIVLRTGRMAPGLYEAPDYTTHWRRVLPA